VAHRAKSTRPSPRRHQLDQLALVMRVAAGEGGPADRAELLELHAGPRPGRRRGAAHQPAAQRGSGIKKTTGPGKWKTPGRRKGGNRSSLSSALPACATWCKIPLARVCSPVPPLASPLLLCVAGEHHGVVTGTGRQGRSDDPRAHCRATSKPAGFPPVRNDDGLVGDRAERIVQGVSRRCPTATGHGAVRNPLGNGAETVERVDETPVQTDHRFSATARASGEGRGRGATCCSTRLPICEPQRDREAEERRRLIAVLTDGARPAELGGGDGSGRSPNLAGRARNGFRSRWVSDRRRARSSSRRRDLETSHCDGPQTGRRVFRHLQNRRKLYLSYARPLGMDTSPIKWNSPDFFRYKGGALAGLEHRQRPLTTFENA